MKASGGGSGGCADEREACERGHDEGLGFGLLTVAEEEADAGAVYSGGVGVWGLGDDDAGFAGRSDVGDGAEFEAETADVDGGGALGLADEVGDGDLLCAEGFGDADGPLATDGYARGWGLGEDVAGGRVGGVEAIFEAEDEAKGAGLFAGFREGEVGEVGDFDLVTVDGETHGDEGRDERDGEHRERTQNDVEEAVDAAGDFSGDSELHAFSEYIQFC